MESASLEDRRVVAAQLGRSPLGTFEVCVRCGYGFPQVIRVDPVLEGLPFPTLYWLTCPWLKREIGQLEATGWIAHLELRLENEEPLRTAMISAHQDYALRREEALAHLALPAAKLHEVRRDLEGRGIGGIVDRGRLKCLHLHAAHALIDGNPIGDIVLSVLTAKECEASKGICSAYE